MAYTVASVRTYGAASKWSAEAVRARGTSSDTSSSTSANDIFFGPTQSGTDWGAAILTATSTDDAMADYVKRNYSKFTGGTLQAMLESTDLVDWYKQEMQKQIDETKKSIEASQDSVSLEDEAFGTSRVTRIMNELDTQNRIAARKAAKEAGTELPEEEAPPAGPDLLNMSAADIVALANGRPTSAETAAGASSSSSTNPSPTSAYGSPTSGTSTSVSY